MILNNKKESPIAVGLSIVLMIAIVILTLFLYKSMKREETTRIILREAFDREIGKTTILKLFEPTSHELVIDTLFKVWLEKRSSISIIK